MVRDAIRAIPAAETRIVAAILRGFLGGGFIKSLSLIGGDRVGRRSAFDYFTNGGRNGCCTAVVAFAQKRRRSRRFVLRLAIRGLAGLTEQDVFVRFNPALAGIEARQRWVQGE